MGRKANKEPIVLIENDPELLRWMREEEEHSRRHPKEKVKFAPRGAWKEIKARAGLR